MTVFAIIVTAIQAALLFVTTVLVVDVLRDAELKGFETVRLLVLHALVVLVSGLVLVVLWGGVSA